MSELSEMPNVGKVLADKLKQCGINTPDELRNAGSKNIFLRLKALDDAACFSMLQAIEGAIQNIRWHDLSEKSKHDLKEFFMLTKTK